MFLLHPELQSCSRRRGRHTGDLLDLADEALVIWESTVSVNKYEWIISVCRRGGWEETGVWWGK